MHIVIFCVDFGILGEICSHGCYAGFNLEGSDSTTSSFWLDVIVELSGSVSRSVHPATIKPSITYGVILYNFFIFFLYFIIELLSECYFQTAGNSTYRRISICRSCCVAHTWIKPFTGREKKPHCQPHRKYASFRYPDFSTIS